MTLINVDKELVLLKDDGKADAASWLSGMVAEMNAKAEAPEKEDVEEPVIGKHIIDWSYCSSNPFTEMPEADIQVMLEMRVHAALQVKMMMSKREREMFGYERAAFFHESRFEDYDASERHNFDTWGNSPARGGRVAHRNQLPDGGNRGPVPKRGKGKTRDRF
jgi:hypothetical protein